MDTHGVRFFLKYHTMKSETPILKTLNALSHHGRIAILRIVADQAGLSFFKLEKAYDLLCGHCAELEKYLSNMDALKTFGKRISESRCVETGFR